MTGADFYALCSDALSQAYRDKVRELEDEVETFNSENFYQQPISLSTYMEQNQEKLKVFVNSNHFNTALERFTPSVTPDELARYRQIKEQISNTY